MQTANAIINDYIVVVTIVSISIAVLMCINDKAMMRWLERKPEYYPAAYAAFILGSIAIVIIFKGVCKLTLMLSS